MLLKELTHGLLHLFYPRLCEGCSKPLLGEEHTLCIGCSVHLPKTEYHHIADNDTAVRFAGRVPFIHATSFAYFTDDGLLQHLLHGLKYKNKKESGIYLGKQFAYDLQQTDWISAVSAIVPVPLHPKKEAIRGYNQCSLIAEGMSEVLHIPVAGKTLLRTRHTESQTQKTRAERVRNMQDAFEIKNGNTLSGKHILLIDDVLTTGATLEACAISLLAIPVIKISIATIGIAT
jgi:ComF family protein